MVIDGKKRGSIIDKLNLDRKKGYDLGLFLEAIELSHRQIHIAAAFFGLFVLLGVCFAVDQLGTFLFHRGFAKPFFVLGRRIHHAQILYMVVPSIYGALCSLYLLGYIQIALGQFWYNLGWTVLITAIAVTLDAVGDRLWPKIRHNALLHHEWIYSTIPLYVFLEMVKVIV
jgi:hypothetical protein